MATFWVSFANEEDCLGVVIVDADDSNATTIELETMKTIVQRTIELGCNPGPDCSVQFRKIPCDYEIPARYKNRLLTKGEVDHLNSGRAFH
jgi:hypothetical protein